MTARGRKLKNLIHTPPPVSELIKDPVKCLEIIDPEVKDGTALYNIPGYLDQVVLDAKGRYLHWDDLKNKHQSYELALAKWSIIKMARQPWYSPAFGSPLGYIATPNMQRIISLVDRRCTDAGLTDLLSNYQISEDSLADFSDEESIASSQLEGAATTRAVAKKMLRDGRRPRTESEQMILCNRRLMDMAWLHRHDDMTPELLLDFHREATTGVDDVSYHPGETRTTDDVWVGDDFGNIIHRPPEASKVNNLLRILVAWANIRHEKETAWKSYIHPLLKAVILHFNIGYIHPFYDGNGRVARAMSYWMLFRAGYSAFRYISISKLLKEAPKEYARAYLRTETDDMDLTYFMEYQLRIIERAVSDLIGHVDNSAMRLQELRAWMMEKGLMTSLTPTQMSIITSIIYFPEREHTVKGCVERLGISRATAQGVLEQLAHAGVMNKSGGSGRTPATYTGRRSPEKLKAGILNLLRRE